MKNDYLKWGALLFALVATASAEYELARQVGFNQWVAAAVPGALDIYTVRALRAHRDVLAAVAAMIGVNAASHLVTAGLLPVNVPLVVAVSAIAPLVLWRVHRLADEDQAPAEADSRDIVTGSPAASVERVPEVYPVLETAVPEVYPEPTNAVPAGARPLPLATLCGIPPVVTETITEVPVPEPVPAHEYPVPGPQVHREWTIDPTEYPAPVEDDDEPDEEPVYPDPLIPQVRADFPNEVPGVRRLKDQYGIGQPRAQRIRDELAGVAS
ncbi:hypothetical protein ACIRRI_06765 [Streptomyces mirabilis]|uniref:hypothetical protein n=1 Tax=Streptomyces mirabilis TaxID=68239 RepID=UPI0037F8B336